jgi:hypothetical protein
MQFSTRKLYVFARKERIYLPVLCNIKCPLELQVSLLIVIYEGADCGVVATGQHSRRGILFGNCDGGQKSFKVGI